MRTRVVEKCDVLADKLKAKYICTHPIEACIRSSVSHICCCECDKSCKRCQNNPEQCGAKLRFKTNKISEQERKAKFMQRSNIKICENCGKEFKARYKSKKFCSVKCRTDKQTYPLCIINPAGEVMYFRSSVEASEKLYYSDTTIRQWALNQHKSREGYIVKYISMEEYEKVVGK